MVNGEIDYVDYTVPTFPRFRASELPSEAPDSCLGKYDMDSRWLKVLFLEFGFRVATNPIQFNSIQFNSIRTRLDIDSRPLACTWQRDNVTPLLPSLLVESAQTSPSPIFHFPFPNSHSSQYPTPNSNHLASIISRFRRFAAASYIHC